MTLKKPYRIRTMDSGEAPQLDINVEKLYAAKLESRFHHNISSSQIAARVYQSMESGEISVSGTGSPAISVTQNMQERHGFVTYVDAHAMHSSVVAAVTNIVNTNSVTQLQINIRTISGSQNFTNVVTASVTVFYSLVGSSP